MDGTQRIGPRVVQSASQINDSPIYGFSDKGPYDDFCANSQLALTPYPLVKVYLKSQIDAPNDGVHLVVLDAAGPHDTCLHAATMEAVLEAQENRTTHMTVAYRLTFDREADAYRVEEASD
jgi:hypothetical protein